MKICPNMKNGICYSYFNKGEKCDGLNPPMDCPYVVLESSGINDGSYFENEK